MNRIVKFFHELSHPHCIECIQENEINSVCESCETLKMQLSLSNQREKELLSLLVEKNKPQAETITNDKDIKPISPRNIPWRVKQQMLEEQDRDKARVLAEQARIEKELNLEIENATRTTEPAS